MDRTTRNQQPGPVAGIVAISQDDAAALMLGLRMQPAGVLIVDAVAEAVRDLTELHPDGIPAGHLYAHLCGALPYGAFEGIVKALCALGAIRRKANHHLVWVREARS